MGQQAAAAVLGAPGETGELPAAVRHQVQGTEAEQAVEPFRIRSLVAGKEFALPVGKELVPAAGFLVFRSQIQSIIFRMKRLRGNWEDLKGRQKRY